MLMRPGVYTLLIDWESPAKLAHLIAHAALDLAIIVRIGGKTIKNVTDQMTDPGEFGRPEPARRTGRRSEANT
jgi:hypothetical protein